MIRGRETILWVFCMPIVFFYFIGTITGGLASGAAGGAETLLLEGGEGGGFLAGQLVRRLGEQDFAVVAAETTSVALDRYSRRLRLPPAFTDSVLADRPVTLVFTRRTEGIGKEYEDVRVGRAVYSLLADLMVVGQKGQTATAESLARLNETPRSLTLAVSPAGPRQEIPTGFQQAVPGIMVMFVLLVMTTSGAVLLVLERKQGLLKRLAYTPIPRTSVVLGKWGGKLSVGLVQIAFAMLAGTLLFHMDWGPHLGWVIVIMIVYAALTAVLGMLLGSLAPSEGVAVAIGVVTANVLAALGGCWWPIEITPRWMQTLQLFLPTGWAMNGLHHLISFQSGPVAVLPHVIGMALGTVALLCLAVRAFRYT
jgi:ABC-2 type transport system permease protein